MYRILIVDDEIFSIRAIKSGVNWDELQVTELREALHVEQAMEILENHNIDLVICDIEMPGKSGLELIRWIKEEYPFIETILLTCHSEFSYAQQALQMGCIDYLLKPVEYDSLEQTVHRTLEKIAKSRESEMTIKQYQHYYSQWENQLPSMIERFWMELIHKRGATSKEYLEANLEQYRIPLSREDRVFPILISIEQWDKEFSTQDEEILEYALLKAANEMITQAIPGIVIREKSGLIVILCYVPGSMVLSVPTMVQLCEGYIEACRQYFYCRISSYIGHVTSIDLLPALCREMLQAEQQNVLFSNRVILLDDLNSFKSNQEGLIFDLSEVEQALDNKDANQLKETLRSIFQGLTKKSFTLKDLERLYYELIQLVYANLHKSDLSIADCYNREELKLLQIRPKSLDYLQDWAQKTMPLVIERTTNRSVPGSPTVIDAVREFIHSHLDRPISREEIAAYVYLNPAYLSRLFKKETGISIIDFITKYRMDKAKQLLQNTNHKVTAISELVGYDNFPHFARQFKKIIGLTPQQFRKIKQNEPN